MDGNTASPTITTTENATVSYLLSRVLSGDKICKASELTAFLSQWLNDFEENKPVSPGIQELLTHLLLPFGTTAMLERLEGMEASLADTEGWMVKLHALMANKAHERMLQKLESMADEELSFEDLCGKENAQEDSVNDYFVIDPKRTLQFDYDMRDVMTRGDKEAMKKHADVFYITGYVAWTVRSPYWNIALATDDEGNRFLSDDVLDKVLPKWRQILTGETIPTPKYGVVDSFRSWLASEEKKANDLGKPWPKTPINTGSWPSRPKFVSPKTPEPYSRLRTMDAGRISPLESSSNVTDGEQTGLLQEILNEVKDLKSMMNHVIERQQQQFEITQNQMNESWQQAYPPIPQGMQPSYSVPQQGPFVDAQYQYPVVEADWQFWDPQNQSPTPMPGPGPSSARHL
ncbi:hypothetical protein N7519_003268 [Penicillium mononematosum]|uniref:uncharacterized protein n=1 Tax=Penicillium mononematosum TaxID=268346 RepID=UPI0025477E15|nr:uncharacterized protein N7519_003268 [Penicillium mononematosum]KAJ6188360.1 hypothetical protein N7519_003268 [Penicillium mononematosum]